MKKIFSLIAMCLVSLSMKAQSSLVATLTHDGTTTEYYGVNALADAVTSSADGDLITLSPGVFHGTTIDKNLIIRGAGIGNAEADDENATRIDTKVVLKRSAGEGEPFINIEGINFLNYLNLYKGAYDELDIVENVVIKKCDINYFDSEVWEKQYKGYLYGTSKNFTFIQCRIKSRAFMDNISQVSYINCLVFEPCFRHEYSMQSIQPDVNFLNSVVFLRNNACYHFSSNSQNCVIVVNCDWAHEYSFPAGVITKNCIITGSLDDPNQSNRVIASGDATNNVWMDLRDTFSNFTTANYDYQPTIDYSLTSEAQSFKGTDDTQVGFYGGAAPYSSVVTYPHFTTFNVAEKSVDGKISVDIAVE